MSWGMRIVGFALGLTFGLSFWLTTAIGLGAATLIGVGVGVVLNALTARRHR